MEPVEGLENYFVLGVVEADPLLSRSAFSASLRSVISTRSCGLPASKLRRVGAAFGGFRAA